MSEIIDISVGLTEERVEISTTEVSNLEINAIPTVVEVNIISGSTINPGFYDLSDFTNNSSDPFVRYSALDAKQDKITLTTAGSNGPATFISNVLNVPDYSSAPRGLYTQTASSTPVTNTTIETSLLDGGIGTLTVPANGFRVGDSFLAMLTGHVSSVNNHTLRIRIKSGGVVLADTGVITMSAATAKHWKLDINFTVRTLGVSGIASIATGGTFFYTKNASNAFEGTNFSTETSTGFDTTVANTLVITAQWGTANSGDSIYSELFTLTKTY